VTARTLATPPPSPSPSPSPGKTPTAQEQAIVDALGKVPNNNAPSGGSGLGSWGNAKIDVTGVLPGGQLTLDEAMLRFIRAARDNPGMLATVQRALWLGGFYGKNPPQFGLLTQPDQAAFADALLTLARGNEADKPADPNAPAPPGMGLSQFLTQQARLGKQLSPLAAVEKTKTVAEVKLPNPQDLYAVARQAFSRVLGRTASAAEQQAFADYFTSVYGSTVKGGMQKVFDAQVAAQTPPAGDTLPTTEQVAAALPPAEKFALDKQQRIDSEQLRAAPPDVQFRAGVESADAAAPPGGDAAGKPTLTTVDTVAPPDQQVAAEDFARSRNPGEAGANSVARVFNDFLSIISSKGMM